MKLFLILIVMFLFVRLVNFPSHLNFSADQGKFSSKSLQMFNEKKPSLIGPSFSFHIGERYMYQGPYIYYLQLFFLILGGFDPSWSSVVFTVFCGLMIVPLYIGLRNLTNKKVAIFITLIYIFFPYYVHYTRFLWNPNFQFALLPILIYFMGLFKKSRSGIWFLLISFLTGVLLQLHYQFFIAFVGILVYYFLVKKIGWKFVGIFVVGNIIAFFPLIVYDITHKFYNFQTLKLFIEELEILYLQNKDSSSFAPHYYLSLSFLGLILLAYWLRRWLNNKAIISIAFVSFLISAILYFPPPSSARGMSDGWNYIYEQKVYDIIKNENLSNFNVVNLKYDTLAQVQKYLLRKDRVDINFEDYHSNKYLFVVTDREDYMNHPAYEISSFVPSRVVKDWQINNQYKLILLERTT